jgi:hypothetical protein
LPLAALAELEMQNPLLDQRHIGWYGKCYGLKLDGWLIRVEG